MAQANHRQICSFSSRSLVKWTYRTYWRVRLMLKFLKRMESKGWLVHYMSSLRVATLSLKIKMIMMKHWRKQKAVKIITAFLILPQNQTFWILLITVSVSRPPRITKWFVKDKPYKNSLSLNQGEKWMNLSLTLTCQ